MAEMEKTPPLGLMILSLVGEPDFDPGKQGYTQPTPECLAEANASPMPFDDVAYAVDARKSPPHNHVEPSLDEGVAFRMAMCDQLDRDEKLNLRRR